MQVKAGGDFILKILHTADIHLTEESPERWLALEQLVEIAKREEVTALVIAGDLFDHNVQADRLRSRLAKTLGGERFQTVILPGNHDYAAYRSGLYFGAGVQVVNSWQEPLPVGKANFWGLPFEKISKDRLYESLRQIGAKMNSSDYNILLFHGELLDAYFSRSDMGDEGDFRYMPVHLDYFKHLPLRYVLAGHFHSRYAVYQYPGEGLFVYPGSPVAITRRETGKRKANLLVLDEAPTEISLDTHHYEEIIIDLDPFDNANPLVTLDQKLHETDPGAKIKLTVKGLFNGSLLGKSETELVEAMKTKVGKRIAGDSLESIYDVSFVLEDDLFRQFKARLDEKDCKPEFKKAVEEMVIRVFRVVKICS